MNEDMELELLKLGNVYLIEEDLAWSTCAKILGQLDYLASLKKDKISLFINCEGGEFAIALAIIDKILWLEQQGIIVTGIGIGEICSCAALILAMCPVRLISPNSSILLHWLSIITPEEYSDQQTRFTGFYNLNYEKLIIKLAHRCGCSSKKSIEKFVNNVKNSWYLTANEAVDADIVDGLYERI